MVKKGDFVTVLTTNAGEKIVLPVCKKIAKDDVVLHLPTADGKVQTQSNSKIKKGDVVVKLTSPSGEKMAINVTCGEDLTTCENDFIAKSFILKDGPNGFGFCPDGKLPRACRVEVYIFEKLRLYLFPNPDYGYPGGKYPALEPYITNIYPTLFYHINNATTESPKSGGLLGVGPFMAELDSLNWLKYLPDQTPDSKGIWNIDGGSLEDGTLTGTIDITIGRFLGRIDEQMDAVHVIDHKDYPELEQGVYAGMNYRLGLADSAVAVVKVWRKLDLTDTTDDGCNK